MSEAMVRIGECKYCHQQVNVSAPDSMTEEELNQKATEVCDCDAAQEQRALNEGYQKAKKRIKELFGKNEAAETLFLMGVEAVKQGKVEKLSIGLGAGVKGTLSMTSKGKIKVDKTITERECYEE